MREWHLLPGTLLVSCLLVMSGEYYLLLTTNPVLVVESGDWIRILLLKAILTIGFPARLTFPVSYLLWLMAAFSTIVKPSSRKNGWWLLVLIPGWFTAAGFLILVHQQPEAIWQWLYPASVTGVLILGLMLAPWLTVRPQAGFGIQPERNKIATPYSFNFRTRDGWVNLPNPFRGVFVSGGAGSGKSYSVAVPLIHQAVAKNYCGLVYDFKFPTLAEEVNRALLLHQPENIRHFIINCIDLARSHRVNPLKPENMPVVAYAEEYAQAVLFNLWPESIRRQDFWMRSSTALLTAVIWFLKKHHPQQCTLPHAIQVILHEDYLHALSMLATDEQCSDLIRSAITAVENQAEGQIAGVIGTLQMLVTRIASPEITWVLSGDDFSLDLNNTDDPKLLTLGSHPTLTETFAPVLSLIATVALKQMNQPGRRHSVLLLDEAPTLYIPKLEQIPATARSNRIATVYMAQDFSQMVAHYGRETAEVIIANLNNQFYGRAASPATAKHVSELFGKEEKEQQSQSVGRSSSGNRPGRNQSVSKSMQEKLVVRPQDVLNLQVGEFIGVTVESKQPAFHSRIQVPRLPKIEVAIPAFASGVDAEANYQRVRSEVRQLVGQYPKKEYAAVHTRYRR